MAVTSSMLSNKRGVQWAGRPTPRWYSLERHQGLSGWVFAEELDAVLRSKIKKLVQRARFELTSMDELKTRNDHSCRERVGASGRKVPPLLDLVSQGGHGPAGSRGDEAAGCAPSRLLSRRNEKLWQAFPVGFYRLYRDKTKLLHFLKLQLGFPLLDADLRLFVPITALACCSACSTSRPGLVTPLAQGAQSTAVVDLSIALVDGPAHSAHHHLAV